MTAMDIWLLMCMLFVALATFEYAILLTAKYGKKSRRNAHQGAEEKYCKWDNYALKLFMGAYILTVGTYFYLLNVNSSG